MNRQLTGNWYIKKSWFRWRIMVEVIVIDYDRYPEPVTSYQQATDADLINLNIIIL